jgi:hypothetical protein
MIRAESRLSGDVSSMLALTVRGSLNTDALRGLRPDVERAWILFEREYVERTSFQVISLPFDVVPEGVADRNLGVDGVPGVGTSRAHS